MVEVTAGRSSSLLTDLMSRPDCVAAPLSQDIIKSGLMQRLEPEPGRMDGWRRETSVRQTLGAPSSAITAPMAPNKPPR